MYVNVIVLLLVRLVSDAMLVTVVCLICFYLSVQRYLLLIEYALKKVCSQYIDAI